MTAPVLCIKYPLFQMSQDMAHFIFSLFPDRIHRISGPAFQWGPVRRFRRQNLPDRKS